MSRRKQCVAGPGGRENCSALPPATPSPYLCVISKPPVPPPPPTFHVTSKPPPHLRGHLDHLQADVRQRLLRELRAGARGACRHLHGLLHRALDVAAVGESDQVALPARRREEIVGGGARVDSPMPRSARSSNTWHLMGSSSINDTLQAQHPPRAPHTHMPPSPPPPSQPWPLTCPQT
jgi:hypothetical protein